MKLGVETPGAARRRRRGCRSTAIEDRPGGGLRIGATVPQQRPRRRPRGARALPAAGPGAARRRVRPAAQHRHRRRQPAAAHPLRRTSRTSTKPCNKREPGLRAARRATGEHRDLAILGALGALRRHPPVGPGRRAGRARRGGARRRSRTGPRTIPLAELHRLPGRRARARHGRCSPGELITAVELPPLPSRRASALPQGPRPGARSRSRSARSPPPLDVEDGVVRDVRLALGAVAHRPWRARTGGGRPARAAGRAEAAFRAAADAELARPRAAARQRAQGAAGPQRHRPRRSPELRRVVTDRRPPHADRRRRSTAVEGARQGDRARPLRLRVSRSTALAYGWAVQSPRSRRGGSRRSTPDRRWPCRACSPSSRHGERAAGCSDAGDAELAVPAVRPRSPTAARSSPPSWPRRSRRRARPPRLVRVDYDSRRRTTSCCAADHPRLYAPEQVNPACPTDTEQGDVDAALAAAAVRVDATYPTPAVAQQPDGAARDARRVWDGDDLTALRLHPGRASVQRTLAAAVRARAGRGARASPSTSAAASARKGSCRGRHVVLAAMAAQVVGPPVKRRAHAASRCSRCIGYRTPTIQRIRLGAERRRPAGRDRPRGRRADLDRERVRRADRGAHADRCTPRRTAAPRHRLVRARRADAVVDARAGRVPGHVRARVGDGRAGRRLRHRPGRAARSATSPTTDPEPGCRSAAATSSPACARAPSGSAGRTATRARARAATAAGCVGTGRGRARPTRPAARRRRRRCRVDADGALRRADRGRRHRHRRPDGAHPDRRRRARGRRWTPSRVRIGDSDFAAGAVAGGSMGTASWGWAVVKACRALRDRLARRGRAGGRPDGRADTAEDVERAGRRWPGYAFGAQFAEVRVDADTGEVRVPRLLGVFAAGRIVNPTTARSQLIGGMTMGLSMALHEESVMDARLRRLRQPRPRRATTSPAYADVASTRGGLDRRGRTPSSNPMGVKGIGEIGIVGTAAAIANAVYHATGSRHPRPADPAGPGAVNASEGPGRRASQRAERARSGTAPDPTIRAEGKDRRASQRA